MSVGIAEGCHCQLRVGVDLEAVAGGGRGDRVGAEESAEPGDRYPQCFHGEAGRVGEGLRSHGPAWCEGQCSEQPALGGAARIDHRAVGHDDLDRPEYPYSHAPVRHHPTLLQARRPEAGGREQVTR